MFTLNHYPELAIDNKVASLLQLCLDTNNLGHIRHTAIFHILCCALKLGRYYESDLINRYDHKHIMAGIDYLLQQNSITTIRYWHINHNLPKDRVVSVQYKVQLKHLVSENNRVDTVFHMITQLELITGFETWDDKPNGKWVDAPVEGANVVRIYDFTIQDVEQFIQYEKESAALLEVHRQQFGELTRKVAALSTKVSIK